MKQKSNKLLYAFLIFTIFLCVSSCEKTDDKKNAGESENVEFAPAKFPNCTLATTLYDNKSYEFDMLKVKFGNTQEHNVNYTYQKESANEAKITYTYSIYYYGDSFVGNCTMYLSFTDEKNGSILFIQEYVSTSELGSGTDTEGGTFKIITP